MASNLDGELPQGAASMDPRVTTFTPTTVDTPDSTTRKWVSYLLLGLLTAIVIAAFTDMFLINAYSITGNGADATDRLMRLMNLVFGPVVTLFSSVVGFYFGARTAKESGQG